MIKFINKMIKSTLYAFRGLWWGFYTKKNLTVLLVAGLFVFPLLIWLKIPLKDFGIIMFFCVNIIVVEVLNTGLERLADVVDPKYNRQIGLAKDIAAGAVLLASISAIVFGFMVIWEPLMEKLMPLILKLTS